MVLVSSLVQGILSYLPLFNQPIATSVQSPHVSFKLRAHHSHHPTDPSALLLSTTLSPSSFASTSSRDPLIVRTRKVKVYKPKSQETYQAARFKTRTSRIDQDLEWEGVEVEGPDVTDRETLSSLAKMTSNAYVLPSDSEWFPIDGYNTSVPVGWEPDADRLRGHIFASDDNSTVIISLKGTSAGLLGSGGPTAKNDRFNDNLLFSCCCARVDFTWFPVCDCYAGGWKCEQTCVEKALIEESVYYPIATNLYNNISNLYPHANIWLTGHSLGGALASLIGTTFGAPVVAYESPGDRMAAERLHLPLPPPLKKGEIGALTHVYHTADPIPMGTCTGKLSSCYVAGFALEARCHLGETILYDTVNKLGWSVDIRTHRIGEVINRILNVDWDDGDGPEKGDPPTNSSDGNPDPGTNKPGKGGKKKGLPVPRPEREDDCVDCYRWEFGDGYKN
ncbi:alpha beta-hydrolase [Phaffia rhodozyma]|uniref:triacylglycerol lipase n=1 Tax=Phaffia rhodozyma TaxID=264483 RepID=A0A0F7SX77_PHARH|nr:alpha beta-hydrolase [Phaffia rhodozyma]